MQTVEDAHHPKKRDGEVKGYGLFQTRWGGKAGGGLTAAFAQRVSGRGRR